MKNVLKKGIAFTLALTLSVSSANVSLFITKADQQAEEKSNVENSNFTVNSETVKPKVVEEVMSDRTTDSIKSAVWCNKNIVAEFHLCTVENHHIVV